jgi:hypothetical protein
MSNISDYRFVLYERLASQKLNEILSQLNSHNHGSSGGVTIDVSEAITDGTLDGSKLIPGSVDTLQLADGCITTDMIEDGAVTAVKLGNDIHITADGYAVYAP